MADRDESLDVFKVVNEVLPKYKEVQDGVIKQVAEIKMEVAVDVNEVQKDIMATKETTVKETIRLEKTILDGIDQHEPNDCLETLRDISNGNTNNYGIFYKTCLDNARKSLNKEVSELYEKMKLNEDEYMGIGIFDAFNNQNIFTTPGQIKGNLNEILGKLEELPNVITEDLTAARGKFKENAKTLKAVYTKCMEDKLKRFKSEVVWKEEEIEECASSYLYFW